MGVFQPSPVTSVNGMTGDVIISDVGGIADPGANGIISRTALNTTAARTITGTANQIAVTNGDGVSGNPTLSLPQNIHTGATPTFAGASLTAAQTITGSTDAHQLLIKGNATQTNDLLRLVSSADALRFKIGGDGTMRGFSFEPLSNVTHASGSSFNYWLTTYTRDLYFNSTAYISGVTAGQVTLTGNLTSATNNTYTLGTSSLYWSNTYTNRLYLNSTAYLGGGTAGAVGITGLVGIGTGSPVTTIEAVKTSSAVEAKVIQLRNSATDSGTATTIRFRNSTSEDATLVDSSGIGEITVIRTNAPSSGYSEMAFRTNTGERMRLSSVGMGIGTATIGTLLTLKEGTTAADGITFGTDTNLYRSGTNTLRTDDNFVCGSGLNMSSQSITAIGSNITFTAAGTINNGSSYILLSSAQNVYIRSAAADAVNINDNNTGAVNIAASGGKVGFYGATPIAKQTGVAVSAAGIHAALVNLGLIAA